MDSLEILTSFLFTSNYEFALGLCGGEYGICATGCVNPKWDHWQNILTKFKVQSPWRILIGYYIIHLLGFPFYATYNKHK